MRTHEATTPTVREQLAARDHELQTVRRVNGRLAAANRVLELSRGLWRAAAIAEFLLLLVLLVIHEPTRAGALGVIVGLGYGLGRIIQALARRRAQIERKGEESHVA